GSTAPRRACVLNDRRSRPLGRRREMGSAVSTKAPGGPMRSAAARGRGPAGTSLATSHSTTAGDARSRRSLPLFQEATMANCTVCGNDYDKAFTITMAGETQTFDSFECAIHALAPVCTPCACKIVG